MKKIIFILILIISGLTQAQSVITGVVMDGDFNEPLAFANVVLSQNGSEATITGAITDFEGRYTLETPGAGTYNVAFSFLGYETVVVSDVKVTGSEEVIVNITLNPSSNALEEVVLTVSAKKNNEAAVLAIQKGAVTLLDGLSAQTIRKSGDSNVAAAIKRIPGVSVQGGKFVYVRGLGDRYSKTLLGGLEVPGLDPDKNTLQLDIFPTSLLENILVSKSASADQPADFTGGIVDVILRDFSNVPEYNISISTGYNPSTNFKDAPALPSYSLNALSFDSGVNDLPFPSTLQIPFAETFLSPAQERVLVDATRSFTPQMGVSRENNLMDYTIGATASNQYKIGEETAVGYIAAINYRYDSDYYEEIYNGVVSKQPNGLETFNSQEGELGSIQAIGSGLFGLSLKTATTKHKATVLAIKSGESNAIDGIFQDFIENPYLGLGHIMTHTERNILTIPVSGSYKIKSNWSVDWKVAPSVVSVKDLDFRKAIFTELDNGNFIIDNASNTYPERLWRNLDENSLTGKLDVQYDFKIGDKQSKIKFGGSYLMKDRSFTTDRFSLVYEGRTSDLNGDFNALLAPENIWTLEKGEGSYVLGEFEPTNQYESGSNTIGAYLSNEIKFSERFKSIIGLRYEMYTTTYTGENIRREQFVDAEFIDVADLYPSANLIYSFNEETNLRASYSKTTARPSFKENSSAQIYDPITERFFLGNTELTPTYVDNLDLRWERFGDGNEITAISAFYKKFTDPIEIFYWNITAPRTLIARNNDEALVYGAEIEFRKNILNSDISRLSVNLNTSIIFSELEMGDEEYEGRVVTELDRDIPRTRELQGQSPYLVNIGLNYNLFEEALEVGAYYNVQGRALEVIGIASFPDVYTEPFHSLNLNITKGFGEDKKTSLSLRVDNLLNDVRESRFDYFGNTEFVFSSLRPGTNFKLTLSHRF